jgi:hypothetical protein
MNRSMIASLMIGAAISMGALASAAAPTAHAEKISEGTIKAECKDVGGTYGTVVKQGMRFSTCRYKDISGDGWVDYYADGEYYSTRPT